ncbi:MAG: FAD-binding oxidoreductase [Thermoleophilia bacterium]|jgi:FAD/FMN-containing dehydrogenase|nr:FAD-binding oxidoreductase [Thermoleophilia bacterium]
MATTEAGAAGLRALSERMRGEVVLAGDAGWDTARSAYNLAVDQRPAAVALPEDADDVARVLTAAAEHGLRVAPQGPGHHPGPLGTLEGTVLLRTGRIRGVRVDATARTAWAAGGEAWGGLLAQAGAHGLMPLCGSSAGVGIAGYTLGGGLGWLGRRHGLACNAVRAFEVVTADGRVRRVDAEHEEDLFWALRGGGGSFGVVTGIEMDLFPVPEVVCGWLMWPLGRAAEVLEAWRGWVDALPEEVTSVWRALQLPPLPDLPEPLRGRSFTVVEVAGLLDPEALDALLAPLRALGPEMDTVAPAPVPHEALAMLHMDPPDPIPAAGDGMLLDELPDPAAMAAVVGEGSGSPLISYEFRHTGGALGRPAPDGGALEMLPGRFAAFGVGAVMGPGMKEAIEAHLDRVGGVLAAHRATTSYMNFAERGEAPLHPPAVLDRLRAVKAAHDPGDLIRANHPVAPTAPAR